MEDYQCYYLDGPDAGRIEPASKRFREGPELRTLIGASHALKQSPPRPIYHRFNIPMSGKIYCVASVLGTRTINQSDIDKAIAAGLKPYP